MSEIFIVGFLLGMGMAAVIILIAVRAYYDE